MFRLRWCCVQIMWRPPNVHHHFGFFTPNPPFQPPSLQVSLHAQSQSIQQASRQITPDLEQLRAQAEAYRIQQEQQQQAQYILQQQILQQQQHQQHQQQLFQQQQQQIEQQYLPVQSYSPIHPPLVAHKFYLESSREFYDRFYSLPSPSPINETEKDTEETESLCSDISLPVPLSPVNDDQKDIQEAESLSQDVSHADKDIHSLPIDLCEEVTEVSSDVELVEENSPSGDSTDSEMKRRPRNYGSKRPRNDSYKAEAKQHKVADPEIEDDPAVLAVGRSTPSHLQQPVSSEAVQFLGGRVRKLDMRQERHYSKQAASASTQAAASQSKFPAHPLRNREWTRLTSSKSHRDHHHVQFSVMSYNVLAQQLIQANPYLYETASQNHLAWEYRKENLLQEMMQYQPDVMCLQEVQKSHFEDFYKPRLKSFGYDGLFICRTGDKYDGCATFYKTSKFVLDAHEALTYCLPRVNLMDRDNVGLVVRLKPKRKSRKGTKLIIGNTHLLFNPKRGDIKLAQLQLLLAALDRMAYDSKVHKRYHPMILCGDMNAKPHSDLFRFLTNGQLHYQGLLIRSMAGFSKQRGPNTYLGNQLLPKSVGITDGCQYADDVVARLEADSKGQQLQKHAGTSAAAVEKSEGELSDDSETETKAANATDIKDSKAYKKRIRFESGELRHHLQLRSVYDYLTHTKDKRPIPTADLEVTTHHGLACEAVDYIFYSCRNKNKKPHKSKEAQKGKDAEDDSEQISDSKLKVVSRLALPRNKDMEQIGCLPNEAVSSDHVLLMTKFALNIG